MSVTRAELEGAVEVLNNRLGLPTDGQSLGSIYTYGAYGGWQLMQIAPRGSGQVTHGFVSKPALYAKTWDIIKGVDLARRVRVRPEDMINERNPEEVN